MLRDDINNAVKEAMKAKDERKLSTLRMVNSTIKNAAAPVTGGMICPLTDDATSTAPAFSAEKPTRFIMGMVKVPVVTTLAIDDPEIIPVSADATTAALAGPPRIWPSKLKAS